MEPNPIPPPRELADRFRRAQAGTAADLGLGEPIRQADELFRATFRAEPERHGAASGFVPIQAEHTHYFGGFGLLARLPQGVAVAARPNPDGAAVTAVGADTERAARLIEALQARLARSDHESVRYEVAVVSTLAGGGEEALLGAVAAAFLRAVSPPAGPPLASAAAGAIEEILGRPYGPSYYLAAEVDAELVLVDAGTGEAIEVERPERAGFGLLEVGAEHLPAPAVFWERAAVVESSLEQLREGGFANLSSLRRLEHQDLPGALQRIDSSARPIIRHLVAEDRRVTRIVAALKRSDPQLVGALLLMSFASQRDDLRSSVAFVDAAIEYAEAAEGVYGARMAGAGYGGRILLVGRPFLIPHYLEEIATQISNRFELDVRALTL